MARSGAAASLIQTTGTLSAPGSVCASFHYRNTAVPGAGARVRAFSLGDAAPLYDLYFAWHNPNAAERAAVLWRKSDGTYVIAQAVTAFAANTWYVISVNASAGSVDVFVNGVREASVASGSADTSNPATLGLLGDAAAAAEYDTGGTVAEFGLWNVALGEDVHNALGKKFSPVFLQPQNRVLYAPLVRNVQDWHGNALTDTGTSAADHSPVLYPDGPRSESYAASPGSGSGAAVASFGVFGPRTHRGRRQQLYFHRARRWPTVAYDSFNTANTDQLGLSDSGHNWTAWNSSGVARPWTIQNGAARPAAGATGKNWAGMAMGVADVRLRAHVTPSTLSGEGLGLAFRQDRDGNGHLFHWDGAAWRLSQIDDVGLVTHWANLGATPALVSGTRYRLEVRLLGPAVSAYVDGVQVGATQTNGNHQLNSAHGMFADGARAHAFDNVTAEPYA